MNRPVELPNCLPQAAQPASRRPTRQIRVGWAGRVVRIGGDAPVVVQSMTNTDTVDAIATAIQVKQLAQAGSEIVRITVNSPEAAAEVASIREQLDKMGIDVPLVGDFHYNGHKLLTQFPACAQALSKYRINPGNVGRGAKGGDNFAQMIEVACRYRKPVRIGVNWGSLDQELLAKMMDENAQRTDPLDAKGVLREALVQSAIASAERAEALGLGEDMICLSAKVSGVQDLIAVYRELSRRCDYPLHLGLTEAGMGSKGIVASTAALSVLLAGRHWRHHPHFADAGARRVADDRGAGRAGNFADGRATRVHADGRRVPGLRAHYQHVLSGAGRRHSIVAARADAALAG